MKAEIAKGFAAPTYHVESFPIGSCVCNVHGFNCLTFPDHTGRVFTSFEEATRIAAEWNAKEGKQPCV